MASNSQVCVVALRRQTQDRSWGFTLQGGIDQGMPTYVLKVNKNSIAAKAGLDPGDVVLMICKTNVTNYTHAQVKAEILRAGNDLDFTAQKHAIDVSQFQKVSNPAHGQDERVKIVEQHNIRHGGPVHKNVETKTFKMLKEQLPESESGGAAPSSLWERPVDQRSGYLVANDKTIQRAYGEEYDPNA